MTLGSRGVSPSWAGSTRTPSRGRGEGPGVFEIVSDYRSDTYRAVYTVRLENAIYVLHASQKKSPKGIKTAKSDVELVAQRLRTAREDYLVRNGKDKS